MAKLAILGGDLIRTKEFPNRKSMGQAEIDAATRVLKSDVLSGFIGAAGKYFNGGKEVNEFEKLWATTYGFKHAISINSSKAITLAGSSTLSAKTTTTAQRSRHMPRITIELTLAKRGIPKQSSHHCIN